MIRADSTYDEAIDIDGQTLIKHVSNNVTKYYSMEKGLESTKLHRKGGPARETPDTMEYYQEGKLHREDGPAVITNLKKAWYLNGMLHRLDGPAIEYSSGKMEYYQSGKLHREDGPAVIYPSGAFEYYSHGELHRKIGPARLNYVCAEYFQHGKRHRNKEPAVMYVGEIKEYWARGSRHRDGRPAIIVPETNYKENYWLHNIPYVSENAKEIIPDDKVSKLQDIHAWIIGSKRNEYAFHQDDGRPALVTENEIKYFSQGMLHNEKGPAIIARDRLIWYRNNNMHRDRGAAFVSFNMENVILKYYNNGLLHNFHRPAYINLEKKRVEWHVNGVLQKCKSFATPCDELNEYLSDAFLETFGDVDLITRFKADQNDESNSIDAVQTRAEEQNDACASYIA